MGLLQVVSADSIRSRTGIGWRTSIGERGSAADGPSAGSALTFRRYAVQMVATP